MSQLIAFWMILNFIPLLAGMSATTFTVSDPCSKPLSKIEYVFPGYQVGCWLGKPWKE